MSENKITNQGFQWDQYWSNGNIHSLSNAFTGNYEGAIAQFWKDKFSSLEDGAKILDIGTGNGAVAFLAAEVALEKRVTFHISGIDLAKIDPASAAASHPELEKLLPFIEFQGEISADVLPFESATFDLIVGQYALEYTSLKSTMAELRRVLNPHGQLSFIMHHVDSIIMQTTRDELEQAKLLFEETKLFLRARSMVKAMGDANTPEKREKLKYNKSAEKKRDNLNQAFSILQQRVEISEDPTFLLKAMNYVLELFKSKALLPMNEKLRYLKHSQQLIEGNRERIQDLYNACFDSSRSDEFNELCEINGFNKPEFSPFYNENNQLLGWTLQV